MQYVCLLINKFINLKSNFMSLFLAVLGLLCCGGFSLVQASGGNFLVAMCRLLIVMASLVVEHRLQGVPAA